MKNKLLIIILFVFYYGNSQQFSLENLQTNEEIEIALDSAYQWMEYNKLEGFTENYLVIDNAIELTQNEEFSARFSAYKAVFYSSIYDNTKFEYFLNHAFDYYQKHDNKEMLIYIYNLKGLFEAYINLDHKEALNWEKKALNLLTPGDKNLEQISVDVYFNMTLCTSDIKDWDGTFENSTKCIQLAKKHYKSRLPRMYYHRGMALLHQNDIQGAINNFKLAEKYLKEIEASTGKKTYRNASYLYGFSEAYRALGKFKKSADYLKEYNSRVDESVKNFSEALGKRIQNHSNLLVGLAKKKEVKAQEKLKKSELFYNALTLGLALLIIGVLLVFIFQQRKHEKLNIKKNNLLTSKNKELITVKEEVENALKVKTDFLNSITHELRTPLYAINSITRMIKKKGEIKMDTSQFDILSFSGDHLLRFINDVIDFNMGANNFEFQHLKLESINLENLLDKIKNTIKFSLIMTNENKFAFNFDPAISKNLKIDSLKLSRIIINLLNNSSKYTQEGKILFNVKQLDVNTKTSTVEFCIKDTGKGISKAQLNEINTAFNNNNKDLVKRINNKASGLGIGLVMVNRLLKLHNSKLNIESQEGIGTTMTFKITFAIDTNKNETISPNLTKPTQHKKHILIVDDNKINLIVTSRIIKELGHTCQSVSSGAKAIDLFKKKNTYDIILMDIMMPEMDGFEATEIIKSINPKQKIIALTAMSIRENKQKFEEIGFENIIEKPFALEKFGAAIT